MRTITSADASQGSQSIFFCSCWSLGSISGVSDSYTCFWRQLVFDCFASSRTCTSPPPLAFIFKINILAFEGFSFPLFPSYHRRVAKGPGMKAMSPCSRHTMVFSIISSGFMLRIMRKLHDNMVNSDKIQPKLTTVVSLCRFPSLGNKY